MDDSSTLLFLHIWVIWGISLSLSLSLARSLSLLLRGSLNHSAAAVAPPPRGTLFALIVVLLLAVIAAFAHYLMINKSAPLVFSHRDDQVLGQNQEVQFELGLVRLVLNNGYPAALVLRISSGHLPPLSSLLSPSRGRKQ